MVITTEDEILIESVSDFTTDIVKNLVLLKAIRWLDTSYLQKNILLHCNHTAVSCMVFIITNIS